MVKGSSTNVGLWLCDVFISFCIIFPLCIFHWRGTWELGNRLIPDDHAQLLWIGMSVCTVATILVSMAQGPIEGYFRGKTTASSYQDATKASIAINNTIPSSSSSSSASGYVWGQRVYSRLYLYTYNWLYASSWRMAWCLLDLYLSVSWVALVSTYLIATLIKCVTRTARWSVNSPLSLSRDTDDTTVPMTVFKVKSSPTTCSYGLDLAFTIVVISACDVIAWRSIFLIYDKLLLAHFQMTPLHADVISLSVGYALMFLLVAMETPLGKLCVVLTKYGTWPKLIIKDTVWLLAGWCSILAWRGGWNLCTDYVMPRSLLGDVVCHVVGGVGLFLLLVYSTAAVSTGPLDTEEDDDEQARIFDIRYVQHYFGRVKSKTGVDMLI